MRIEVRGRNTTVTETLRQHVEERFTTRIGKQVSELAELDVEVREEKSSASAAGKVAEATLRLKGVTLRARESSDSLEHSVDLVADKLARQVKRHREKRRGRRESHMRTASPPPQSP